MEDLLERWRSEKAAAYLAGAVAAAEPDPTRAKLFRQMADAAEEQAAILAKDLPQPSAFTRSLRARLTVFLLGIFGPCAMRHVLSARKCAAFPPIAASFGLRRAIPFPPPSRRSGAATNPMPAVR
jgi:hypothetical protein